MFFIFLSKIKIKNNKNKKTKKLPKQNKVKQKAHKQNKTNKQTRSSVFCCFWPVILLSSLGALQCGLHAHWFPPPSRRQLQIASGSEVGIYVLRLGLLCTCAGCLCCHSLCEALCLSALLCLDDSGSFDSCTTSGSQSFRVLFHIPEPCGLVKTSSLGLSALKLPLTLHIALFWVSVLTAIH